MSKKQLNATSTQSKSAVQDKQTVGKVEKHIGLTTTSDEVNKRERGLLGLMVCPSLSEILDGDLGAADEYLSLLYTTFIVATCSDECPQFWVPRIKEWVFEFGKTEAKDIIEGVNAEWARNVPSLWKVYCEGTPAEAQLVKGIIAKWSHMQHDLQAKHELRHMKMACRCGSPEDPRKDAPILTTLEQDLLGIDAIVEEKVKQKPATKAGDRSMKRTRRQPWMALLKD